MQALAQISRAAPGVSSSIRSTKRQRAVRASAQIAEAETQTKEVSAPSVPAGKAEIYIGHAKDQLEEKKSGAKGRFVVDDPTKYPGRDDLSLVGGWAGGEKGLKAFVADYQRELELNGAPAKKADKAARAPQPIAKGDDTIYVGKGRVIKDDARKYPGRNELVGGFAGGELGLAAFKESGDIPIAPEGQGKKQSSPLIIAFVVGLAATGGGLLLSTLEEVGENVVSTGSVSSVASLGLDDGTKSLLTAGILLVGVLGSVAGAQLLVDTMATKIKAGASKLAILGAFWLVVFLAAKLVLEN